MPNSYYPYFKEELEDGTVGYLFLTDLNIIYNISFDDTLYSNYLDLYPCLLQRGFGFGFYPESIPRGGEKKYDSKVSETIIKIAEEFLSSQNDDSFLLYHCESKDGKQELRHKLFDKWYNRCEAKGSMYKHGIEVEISTATGDKQFHYIGFISKANNKYLNGAIIELEQFSGDLVCVNLNKNPA